MKKYLSILFIGVAGFASAQQISLNSQYLFNEMLVNPGAAGSKDFVPIQLSFRKQWVNFPGSPTTQALSAHGEVGKNMGFGGTVFNDVAGPSRRTGLNTNAAYHLQLDRRGDHQLGLGLRRDLYDFGNPFYNPLVRTYYFLGGYEFELSPSFDLKTTALVQMIETFTTQFDVTALGTYKKVLWLGVSYRHLDAVAFMAGAQAGPVRFGYSYDYTLSDIGNYSSGSHEVFLELQLSTKNSGNKTPWSKRNRIFSPKTK